MEDNSESKTKKYNKLINHFDKLQDSKYHKVTNKKEKERRLPFLINYTGLQKGKVFDIELKNNQIKLFIRTKYETYECVLNTDDNYSKDVEFVRFLLYYDIKEPFELIGKEIILIKNSNSWNLYIPDNLTKKYKIKYHIDKFMRYLGYHQLHKKSTYELFMGSFMLFSVSITFSTIIFYLYQYIINYEASMNIFVLLVFISPVILSIIYRLKKMYIY